jgi:outer membrane protein
MPQAMPDVQTRGFDSVMRSMKSTILSVAAASVLGALPSLAQAELKIGVLNYGRLMDESPQGKVLLEQLRNEAAAKQRELQTQAASLKTRQEKLVKDRATMSADQVSRSEKDIRDGERDLARRQSEIQDDFNSKRNEEMSKLQRSLIDEVQNYARAQNFDLIITDGVIYATQAIDVTAGVLQTLQARGGTPAAGAAPRPAPAATAAPAAPRPAGR